MKMVSVVGARPQFIKHAALTRLLRSDYSEILVHTGQHYDYDLSETFFEELNIPMPDYNLGIGSGTHGYQTGHMLIAIEEILLKEKPEMVLLYGDTNSTLAGALAACKLHIPLAHVEAGLRQADRAMPEEMNRILTDHCSSVLLCPTKASVDNLYEENVRQGVYLTGDVMADILLEQRQTAIKSSVLNTLGLTAKQYVVVTMHRAGNTDDPEKLQGIVDALCQIDEVMVFPMHPRTESVMKKTGLYDRLKANDHIKVIRPLSYLDFLKLMDNAHKILTDSGGIEKEAYILKVPCVTMLESTAWGETVRDGWNVLVGTDTRKIVDMVQCFEPSGEQREDFGGGAACGNIKKVIDSSIRSISP
jgi:UDP-N-acetylglucosamine 2-epimerase (non-hydrolysing)